MLVSEFFTILGDRIINNIQCTPGKLALDLLSEMCDVQ